jgi:hypothetical protein
MKHNKNIDSFPKAFIAKRGTPENRPSGNQAK